MENIRTRPLSAIEGPLWRRVLPQGLALVYILLALATYLAVPFLAQSWIQLPFIGAFVEQTLVFNGVGPTDDPASWPAYSQGLTLSVQDGEVFYYQLKAIDGRPVVTAQDMAGVLSDFRPGDQVTLLVRSSDGGLQEVPVPLVQFPLSEQISFFYVPYLIGLVYLGAGVWVFAIRRHHSSGRVFALFTVSIALGIGLLFDVYTTHVLTPLWTVAVALIGGSATALALLFPRPDPFVQQAPWRAHIGTLIGILLAAFAVSRLYDYEHPFDYAYAWSLIYGFVALSLLFILGWAVYRRSRVAWPTEREQVRWIALGALFSFTPIGVWLISRSLGGT